MLHSELKAAREALHLSQSEMAERLAVSRHTYMRWESGATKKLPGDIAARIGLAGAGKAAQLLDRGEAIIEIDRHSHPKWYEKVSSKGVYVKRDSHPGFARLKRKHLEAYEHADWATWNAFMEHQFPTLEEAMGIYETTGQDDDETERRMQNFFSNPT